MTLDFKRALVAWAAVLLMTVALMVPWSGAIRGWGLILTLALLVACAIRLWPRPCGALTLDVGERLPPAAYRQPVVLVCGDGLDGLFGAEQNDAPSLRQAAQGCYLRVGTLEAVPDAVAGILAARPGWAGQLNVMMVVNPDAHGDAQLLSARLQRLAYQLALARKAGADLPLMLVTYVAGAGGEGPWFSWECGEQGVRVRADGRLAELPAWQVEDGPVQGDRLRTSVYLDCVEQWLAETVLVHCSGPKVRHPLGLPVVCAVSFVAAVPQAVPNGLWRQWIRTVCGVERSSPPSLASELPFPDALLHLLPVRSGDEARWRAGNAAMCMTAVALLVAMCSSAWENHLLVRQVGDDLWRFHALSAGEYAQREGAVKVLRDDAARLDDHFRYGEPWSLGWGFYRGAPLREPVYAAIAGYRGAPATPVAAPAPGVLRLDSLSLFASGSADLKPDSTRVLINVLVGIKAQPPGLIVIAGHTDTTGSEVQNLALSRARAAAVRDWLQRMGEIPGSCFAVQGHGASQPVAANDTETGRAANRRVDIRLVPQAGACGPLTTVTGDARPVASSDIQ